jgi:hypothetical protein
MPYETESTSSPPLYRSDAGRLPAGFSDDRASSSPITSTVRAIEDYARNEPWVFATWVFGLGFVLGWKLKPW